MPSLISTIGCVKEEDCHPLLFYLHKYFENLDISMKYHLDIKYCWMNDTKLVLMYSINGVPYTFDDVEESLYYDSDIIEWANDNGNYTLDDMYRWSSYLINELCHPLLFELELENPELLPVD